MVNIVAAVASILAARDSRVATDLNVKVFMGCDMLMILYVTASILLYNDLMTGCAHETLRKPSLYPINLCIPAYVDRGLCRARSEGGGPLSDYFGLRNSEVAAPCADGN